MRGAAAVRNVNFHRRVDFLLFRILFYYRFQIFCFLRDCCFLSFRLQTFSSGAANICFSLDLSRFLPSLSHLTHLLPLQHVSVSFVTLFSFFSRAKKALTIGPRAFRTVTEAVKDKGRWKKSYQVAQKRAFRGRKVKGKGEETNKVFFLLVCSTGTHPPAISSTAILVLCTT